MYFTLISLFFAFFSFKRALIYSILFIPIVFILNLIRIILTCIIIQKFGYTGIIFHDVYWIFDGVFTFILFYIVYKINEKVNAKWEKGTIKIKAGREMLYLSIILFITKKATIWKIKHKIYALNPKFNKKFDCIINETT